MLKSILAIIGLTVVSIRGVNIHGELEDTKKAKKREVLNKELTLVLGVVPESVAETEKPKKFVAVEPVYVLFSDGKTIMSLWSQDEYDYHDCDPSASVISVEQNVEEWKRITGNLKRYPEATTGF